MKNTNNEIIHMPVSNHKKAMFKTNLTWTLAVIAISSLLAFAYAYNYTWNYVYEAEMRAISKVKTEMVVKTAKAFSDTSEKPEAEMSMREWIKWRTESAGMPWKMTECVIRNESGWNENAVGINSKKSLGVDLGIFQINTKFHPNISNKDKMDYKKATEYAIKIWESRGKNYSAWYGANNCK